MEGDGSDGAYVQHGGSSGKGSNGWVVIVVAAGIAAAAVADYNMFWKPRELALEAAILRKTARRNEEK